MKSPSLQARTHTQIEEQMREASHGSCLVQQLGGRLIRGCTFPHWLAILWSLKVKCRRKNIIRKEMHHIRFYTVDCIFCRKKKKSGQDGGSVWVTVYQTNARLNCFEIQKSAHFRSELQGTGKFAKNTQPPSPAVKHWKIFYNNLYFMCINRD